VIASSEAMTVAAALRPARRRRILVVDDDPHARRAVARLLVEEGYETTEAADGEEASGLLASWRPDLVVTDLEMPRLDGWGLVEEVRRRRPGTPVLVLSARCDPVADTVAEGFFPKPVCVESLLARIRDLVGV
jgi:DNA-binding response OmpR family regulator